MQHGVYHQAPPRAHGTVPGSIAVLFLQFAFHDHAVRASCPRARTLLSTAHVNHAPPHSRLHASPCIATMPFASCLITSPSAPRSALARCPPRLLHSVPRTRICPCAPHPYLHPPVLRANTPARTVFLAHELRSDPGSPRGGTPFSDLPDTQALRLTRGTSKAAAPFYPPSSSFLLHSD